MGGLSGGVLLGALEKILGVSKLPEVSGNYFTTIDDGLTYYVSQCKPSEESKGKWTYDFFHTHNVETIDKIRESCHELILINYVDLLYARLDMDDVEWIQEHSTREKGTKVVCDIVVEKTKAGKYVLRPYIRSNEERRYIDVMELIQDSDTVNTKKNGSAAAVMESSVPMVDDSTLDAYELGLKSYCNTDPDIRTDIEGHAQDIKALGLQIGVKPSALKKMFSAFCKIEQHLKGQEQAKSKLNPLAYEAWFNSSDLAPLALPRDLEYQDILILDNSTDTKKTYFAKLAIKVFSDLRMMGKLWIKDTYPKWIKRPIPTNGQLLARPAWKLAKSLKEEKEGQELLPDSTKAILKRLDHKSYLEVLKTVEACRILEQCVFDNTFLRLVEDDEHDRKNNSATLLVSTYLHAAWDDEPYKNIKSKRMDEFNSMWSSYEPLRDFNGANRSKKLPLDGKPGRKTAYLKVHEHTQGPSYKSLHDVFIDAIYFEIPSYQRTYEWDDNNIRTLFDDLYGYEITDATPPLFLGTLLLQEGPAGSNVTEILDGQQRMLTISLICIWACLQLRANSYEIQADHIVKRYLANHDEVEKVLTPKFMPDPRDQHSFSNLLKLASPGDWKFDEWGDMETHLSSTLLIKQYENIDEIFGQKIRTAGPVIDQEQICDLLLRLLQVCHVCRFVLSNSDDPFDTFQRLNHSVSFPIM